MLACMQHASTREEGGVEIYGRDLWMMVSNYFLVFLAVLKLALTTASANLRLRHAADCAKNSSSLDRGGCRCVCICVCVWVYLEARLRPPDYCVLLSM